MAWMAAFVTGAAAVNPNGNKMLSADVLSIYFVNGKPAVINGLRKIEKLD